MSGRKLLCTLQTKVNVLRSSNNFEKVSKIQRGRGGFEGSDSQTPYQNQDTFYTYPRVLVVVEVEVCFDNQMFYPSLILKGKKN